MGKKMTRAIWAVVCVFILFVSASISVAADTQIRCCPPDDEYECGGGGDGQWVADFHEKKLLALVDSGKSIHFLYYFKAICYQCNHFFVDEGGELRGRLGVATPWELDIDTDDPNTWYEVYKLIQEAEKIMGQINHNAKRRIKRVLVYLNSQGSAKTGFFNYYGDKNYGQLEFAYDYNPKEQGVYSQLKKDLLAAIANIDSLPER